MEKYCGKSLSDGLIRGEIVCFDSNFDYLQLIHETKPLVIMAKTLTPHDTIEFNKLKIVAIVVEDETETSHVSILSRVMGLSAIAGIQFNYEWNNKIAIVDGYNGILIVNPNSQELQDYERNKTEELMMKQLLNSYIGKETVAKNGISIKLYANITRYTDINSVLANDSEGIGNFKTEFIYLESSDYPSEEEQFTIYKNIAIKMNGKKVVIRTIDIGIDKLPSYFNLTEEANPALGYRGIRICLGSPEIFKVQLRAILRASAYGNVSIMYPMIISVDEVIQIKKIIKDIMRELSLKGISYDENIEQGIMIETPASVIISDSLAKYVDFFSIGTNDLIQYTLAVDRLNPKLNNIYNPYHPAVLKSIQYVIKNAHDAGIWVSISGELGSDTSMTKRFLEYGIDALTVSPNKVLELRKKISEISF